MSDLKTDSQSCERLWTLGYIRICRKFSGNSWRILHCNASQKVISNQVSQRSIHTKFMPAAKIFKKPHCNLAGKQLTVGIEKIVMDSSLPLASFTRHQQCCILFICWKLLLLVRVRKLDFIIRCMGFKLRTFRFCFDLSMCLARFHAWFPHQLQRIRLVKTVWRLGANSWIQLEKPFHHSATFKLTTEFPKSQQNPGSLTPIHRMIKSSFLTLPKKSNFQLMNGVQNSIPTPFSEGKIVQIMQILKFSHGLTNSYTPLQQTSRIWGPKAPAPWPSCSLHRAYSSKLAREPSMELFQIHWHAQGKILKNWSNEAHCQIIGFGVCLNSLVACLRGSAPPSCQQHLRYSTLHVSASPHHTCLY